MIVIDEEGTAWSWGNNEYGQLGQVRIVSINLKSCKRFSYCYFLLLKKLNPRLFCWKLNISKIRVRMCCTFQGSFFNVLDWF